MTSARLSRTRGRVTRRLSPPGETRPARGRRTFNQFSDSARRYPARGSPVARQNIIDGRPAGRPVPARHNSSRVIYNRAMIYGISASRRKNARTTRAEASAVPLLTAGGGESPREWRIINRHWSPESFGVRRRRRRHRHRDLPTLATLRPEREQVPLQPEQPTAESILDSRLVGTRLVSCEAGCTSRTTLIPEKQSARGFGAASAVVPSARPVVVRGRAGAGKGAARVMAHRCIACKSIARLEVPSEDQWISECPDRAPHPAARRDRASRESFGKLNREPRRTAA